jgi:nucleoside-diphosphate-sugar epimerase
MVKVLVTGATGQIGSELFTALQKKHGSKNVVGTVHKKKPISVGLYEIADVQKEEDIERIILKHKIKEIYHLAALLSATGEKNPHIAWDINIGGLKNVLNLAVRHKVKKIFWPSSIGAFGETTPKKETPQHTIMEPTTMYGVTKLAGEALCHYYFKKYNLDVRSVRFPGLISYKTLPGGGTTDYAVAIFYDAIKKGKYTCFVRKDTVLPMMYMDDAINAIITIMGAPRRKITVRTSYNIAALSFSADELANEIKKSMPSFRCVYKPDARQKIADSWPHTINDKMARKDWGWKYSCTLQKMTKIMLAEIKKKIGIDKR